MKKVVITPVKNEEWVLDTFLSVCETFADVIIIVDQNSQDRSLEICKQHSKCVVIANDSDLYDECARQQILLHAARRIVPGPKVLFALDADEIPTVPIGSAEFHRALHTAAPGTGIFFEKPDLLEDAELCWRHTKPFLIGFIDDHRPHRGKTIHSPRVPWTNMDPALTFDSVKVLHLARLRKHEFYHRQCFYSMLESTRKLSSWQTRWRAYSRLLKYQGRFPPCVPVPPEWFSSWTNLGISMGPWKSAEVNRWTMRVLQMFNDHGSKAFWWEDIWDVDWDGLRKQVERSEEREFRPIESPPIWMTKVKYLVRTILQGVYSAQASTKRK